MGPTAIAGIVPMRYALVSGVNTAEVLNGTEEGFVSRRAGAGIGPPGMTPTMAESGSTAVLSFLCLSGSATLHKLRDWGRTQKP